MPITITSPTPGQTVGPGFRVAFETSFVGPLESGTQLIFGINPDPEDLVLGAYFWTMSGQLGVQSQILGDTHMTPGIPAVLSWMPHGAAAYLGIRLISPSGVVLDAGVVAITVDLQSGAPYVLEQRAATGGGLTVAQQQQLTDVHRASLVDFPGGAAATVGDLIQTLPGRLLRRELITPDRTGQGQLARPGGPIPVNAFGLFFDVVSVPPFLGTVSGNPTRYSRAILKLVCVAADLGGGFYHREQEEYDIGAQQFTFDIRGAQHIQYWIPPGVTIRFSWLLP